MNKITKEDLKIYFKYGPMEFSLKKSLLLFCLIDLPIDIIIYLLVYFIRRG